MHDVLEVNGIPNHFQIYDGAQHAFFNDTRASYDPNAAADAWMRTLAWFGEYLNPTV
jgi:carboxymethylenebutenolidase